jgi:hypothetical protein
MPEVLEAMKSEKVGVVSTTSSAHAVVKGCAGNHEEVVALSNPTTIMVFPLPTGVPAAEKSYANDVPAEACAVRPKNQRSSFSRT